MQFNTVDGKLHLTSRLLIIYKRGSRFVLVLKRRSYFNNAIWKSRSACTHTEGSFGDVGEKKQKKKTPQRGRSEKTTGVMEKIADAEGQLMSLLISHSFITGLVWGVGERLRRLMHSSCSFPPARTVSWQFLTGLCDVLDRRRYVRRCLAQADTTSMRSWPIVCALLWNITIVIIQQ